MRKYQGKQIVSLVRFPKWFKSKRQRERKERKREKPKVGNNNGQLRIATPPLVAQAKPPGPKKKEERLNDGNNNGQLRIANVTSGGARKAAWANNHSVAIINQLMP